MRPSLLSPAGGTSRNVGRIGIDVTESGATDRFSSSFLGGQKQTISSLGDTRVPCGLLTPCTLLELPALLHVHCCTAAPCFCAACMHMQARKVTRQLPGGANDLACQPPLPAGE